MNSQRSIWSDLPLSTGIATMVCYAGVFNDVIGVEELASRLGVSGQDDFYTALNELHLQGSVIAKNGFVGLPHLADKIAVKLSKIATAKHLISSRLDCLNKLGRSPLIKFVGISGSLAANNPTRDRNNFLDIDLFVITRSQYIWPYIIWRGLRNLFPMSKREPELCINYVMDESSLLIANRNFYTATEIRNVIPVSGMETYKNFLKVNNWVDYYYPGFSGVSAPVAVTPSRNLINKVLYIAYMTMKSIKWLSIAPLKRISFKINLHRGTTFNMLSSDYGGYQSMVQKKFGLLAETCFPALLNAELVEKLFPDELSAEIRTGDIDAAAYIVDTSLIFDGKYG